MGKPLPWAGFSAMIPFSAMQQGKQSTETSDFHWGFFPPTPSSLLLCLASACQTLFPQLSSILVSTCPVTTPHASLLTDSMSRCSHTCPAPVWCWVERLLNFGSDDPVKEQNMFRTATSLCLCIAMIPAIRTWRPHLSSGCSRVASFAFLWSWFHCFNGLVPRELSLLCSVIFSPNSGIHCITVVLSERARISCVLATSLSFMIWSASTITRQSLQLIEPLLDLRMV